MLATFLVHRIGTNTLGHERLALELALAAHTARTGQAPAALHVSPVRLAEFTVAALTAPALPVPLVAAGGCLYHEIWSTDAVTAQKEKLHG